MSSRRDFLIKSALLSSSGLFSNLSFGMDALSVANKLTRSKFPNLSSYSPLITLNSFTGTTEISGDTPDEAHEVFWDKDGFIKKKGGLPIPIKSYDVVIVGGGLSGLSSAYHLRDKKVLMLEGNPRLGENARVEKYKDTYMSLGSAYITIPEEDGLIDSFFKEIGVHNKFKKIQSGKHPIIFKGEFVDSFWMGATDKGNAGEFARVYNKLIEIYENLYPELPLIPGMDINRSELDRLDNLRLSQWVRAEFGQTHPRWKWNDRSSDS